MNNLDKANKNLAISSVLLKTAQVQQNSISQNLSLTKKLNYSLPYKIPMRFLFKYELDKNIDASLIKYLNSISTSDNTNLISSHDRYRTSLRFAKLDFNKTYIIQQLIHYFRVCRLDFIKKENHYYRSGQTCSRIQLIHFIVKD